MKIKIILQGFCNSNINWGRRKWAGKLQTTKHLSLHFEGIYTHQSCPKAIRLIWTAQNFLKMNILYKSPYFWLFENQNSDYTGPTLPVAVVLKVLLRPAVSASPGNLLRMKILWAHARYTEWGLLAVGQSKVCFLKPTT